MSAYFPNGTIFSIGTTYSVPTPITAITNANPAVASSAAHTFVANDVLLLSMPSRLDQRVIRVASPTATAFTLGGINTTAVKQFPTGFGVGSAVKATQMVAISQVTDTQSSGGDQQFYQWVYLEDGRQRQRPTFKNARSLALTLDYDPDLPWHNALLEADQDSSVKVLQAALPTGALLYYSVYVGFDGEPSFTINENQKVSASFSLASPFSTRYAV
jgi:hypothetical protein